MFKSFYLAAILAMATLSQANMSITSPVATTKWTRGEYIDIEWIIEEQDLETSLTIELREGPAENLALSRTIAKDIDVNEESHIWKVPSDLKPGDKYAVRFIADTGAERYSHYFQIA
ncbi:hypothetical protein K493DRAFT_299529 [Basidiobolus meristosporus CBS 931.73]|uniref:Yeast cell wall synthesis Kre9/Knh1-like N-terminal domain-containing protein n=1 Tax=Basidiobolus meristosporus CBS 931.73 TaxID=1314790 RepID=A0A1Y1YME8_9FUNG|nr:hypothetical protein K493DRAFT_299529 [Basidiobolus meristosporus CBS 931.73]|eukprot:ORX99190.1 hypothetical protein K493DRAFT_299529 [Basidiobolus meristosporus CBS 931.73]